MTLSPDNVGVLKPLQLLQQRDLPEDGHGDAVLRQREVHRLEGHDLAGLRVARPVHGSVSSCKDDIITWCFLCNRILIRYILKLSKM